MPGVSGSAILKRLKSELERQSRPENMHDYQRFHKEKLAQPMGLKAPVVRKISNQCFREEIKQLDAKDVLALGDFLLASGERYMRFFAFEWAIKVSRKLEAREFGRFENWLKRYVDNWGACDHLCCGALGLLIDRFPELADRRRSWGKSGNRWVRRGAAVCLIVPVKNGKLLEEALWTAEQLLTDDDDLVQKGYGWMLKEASRAFPDEVFAFVMEHRADMPRTALRYAIEKYPADRRKLAMAKPE